MELSDILGELAKAPGDARWMRALGGALGVELSKRRLETLAPVLRALATTTTTGRDDYGVGYGAALQDVVLAFQAEVGAEAEDVEVARLAMASPYVEALGALAAGNATVTAIGLAMGKNKSSASRALAVLREAGLVSVYASPDGNERSRPHALTARGRRVVAEAQKERARVARRKVGTPVRGARVAGMAILSPRKRG